MPNALRRLPSARKINAGYIPFNSAQFDVATNALTNSLAIVIKTPVLRYTEDVIIDGVYFVRKGDAATQVMTGGSVSYVNGSYIFKPTFTPIEVVFGD
ncbi:MAG: hypothetical protein IKU86_03285 [Thermoguttaceae bacterium]|nr:hypothetical protein [Thermoguttaceae bacterium]